MYGLHKTGLPGAAKIPERGKNSLERRKLFSFVVGVFFTCAILSSMLLGTKTQSPDTPILLFMRILGIASHGVFIGLSCYLSSEIFNVNRGSGNLTPS
jgi:predicted MFS family arabinose efflux permease